MTNQQKIKHLNARAGFGLSPAEWQQQKDWSLERSVDYLFAVAQKKTILPTSKALVNRKNKAKTEEARRKLQKEERQAIRSENISWLHRMGSAEHSALLEKMTLFWHGHFACRTPKLYSLQQQQNTLRQHALGSFRDLAQAMTKDVAMIRYLNNQQNRKDQPNENFAREVMELFTIGRGNYTENDIKEAARAFTGWSSNKEEEFYFRERQHDTDSKEFMGRKGNFNGNDIIDILLEQPKTAEFIVRKIYRYFVNAQQTDEAVIEFLTQQFYQSDYDIQQLMHTIFSSDWFYESKNVANRIKSPIELLAGFQRQIGLTIEKEKAWIFLQKSLGQVLFDPPNVAGWKGDQQWIDNSTLTTRLNLATLIFRNSAADLKLKVDLKEKQARRLAKLGAAVDLKPLEKLAGTNDDITSLIDYLLNPKIEKMQAEVMAFAKRDTRLEFLPATVLRILSLPEYQLC